MSYQTTIILSRQARVRARQKLKMVRIDTVCDTDYPGNFSSYVPTVMPKHGPVEIHTPNSFPHEHPVAMQSWVGKPAVLVPFFLKSNWSFAKIGSGQTCEALRTRNGVSADGTAV